MSAQPQEVDDLVRARFTVKDKFLLQDGEEEYRVEYGPESKERFVDLCGALDGRGLEPHLTGTKEECVLTIRRKAVPTAVRSRIPVVLALLTSAAVVGAALLEWSEVGSLAPSAPGLQVAIVYGGCVAALLAVREFGHRYEARKSKSEPNSSFLLPGIPGVTAILPSLGFLSVQRNPAINRDKYFDIMVVGPLLILAASIALEVAKGLATYSSTVQLTSCQSVNSIVSVCPLNPSVLQAVIDRMVGGLFPASQGSLLLSPIGDAATVGFLLFFVSALPMASFDGGHLSTVAWGSTAARGATYLSVLALIVLDTPFYWGIAIVGLLLAGRSVRMQFLDEVSGVSRNKRLLYLLLIVIAFMCVPLPQNLATVPL